MASDDDDDDPSWEYCEGRRLHLRPHPAARCEPWNWKSLAAVFGLAAGLASLVFGALASVAGWLGGRGGYGPLFLRLGTLLLLLSIPLLAAGAHCLDLEDSRAATGRQEREASARLTEGGGARR
jgi:hypothetical protein